jgi:hypothetical protein
MRSTTLRALALTAALLAPVAALAQTEPEDQNYPGPGMMWGNGAGWGPGMMGRDGGYGMMRGCPTMGGGMMRGEDFQHSAAAWLDGQLAYAHTELGITAAQEPLWKAYADAAHDRSTQMLGTHQAMMDAWRKDGSLAFDKAYDLHIQVMQAHLDAMKANRDAALKLYDGLTEDQRKKASWVLPASMCMM